MFDVRLRDKDQHRNQVWLCGVGVGSCSVSEAFLSYVINRLV